MEWDEDSQNVWNISFTQVLYEYVGGGSLRGYIERGQTLPLEQIHFYACQLLNALAYLHSKSIIHKDLRVRYIQIFLTSEVFLNLVVLVNFVCKYKL